MHRYNRITEDKSTYILDVIDNQDNATLTVVFGDKKKHTDVEKTNENIKIFEEQMENQIDDALKRKPLYALRSMLATGSVIATATGAVTTTSGFETLQNLQLNESLTGAAFILGFGCSVIWSIREYSRLSELSTISYRNKHAEKLQNLKSYSHALDSSSRKIKTLIDESNNPFGILNIDKYTKFDLKKIITEMSREEAMKERGITYVKK